MSPNQASLFDLDGTLLKVNSSFYFGKYLYQQGYFSFFRLVQLVAIYAFHKAGIISIESVHHLIFKRLFQGRCAKQISNFADQFIEAHLDAMLYWPAVERLKKAQSSNHVVAILSSSPNFLVDRIAQKFSVFQVDSSLYAIDLNGFFSHIERLVEGQIKATWVAKFRQEHQIPVKNITGYTDNAIDLPFLLSCGIKVVVSPCRKLEAMSVQHGWERI